MTSPAPDDTAPRPRWPRGLAEAYRSNPRRLWRVVNTRRLRWGVAFAAAIGLIVVSSTPDEFRAAAWLAAALGVVVTAWTLRPGLFARWLGRAEREPWRADHRWDPRGAQHVNDATRALLQPLALLGQAGVAFVTCAIAAGSGEAWFWAAPCFVVTNWCFRLWRAWGRGCAYVGFTRFPYHPGEPVEIHFGITPGGPEIETARFVLRRVQEGLDPLVGAPGWRSTFRTRPRPTSRAAPGPHADIALVFDVPADAGGTNLSAAWPVYWELEVVATTTQRPLVDRFLVPLYDRPPRA